MELEKTAQRERQQIELYAHTPDPRDSFIDSRYPITVVFRLTLSKEQWRTATIGKVYDFLPKLPNCRMDKVNLQIESMLIDNRKWLVFTFLCKNKESGLKIFEALAKAIA